MYMEQTSLRTWGPKSGPHPEEDEIEETSETQPDDSPAATEIDDESDACVDAIETGEEEVHAVGNPGPPAGHQNLQPASLFAALVQQQKRRWQYASGAGQSHGSKIGGSQDPLAATGPDSKNYSCSDMPYHVSSDNNRPGENCQNTCSSNTRSPPGQLQCEGQPASCMKSTSSHSPSRQA
eukprot:TRINITY_DN45289_c0_g1_i1.p1 TRINITY_DN45289_c0_g1~~TRINITY_DN45289_c0_g1_i1.p1  ORF type:complete len:180 (+),score=30.99 TRINITY_DN45289_c0_g1_i1:33-572(+)